MTIRRVSLGLALAAGVSLLAGCESSEQKAEKHYRAGIELAEKGDVDRALIELRNVFRFAPTHEEARATYARLSRQKGDIREAYGQYLRLVEQHPDNIEGRRALAEMALDQGNWDEVQRQAAAATALAPDDPVIRAINVSLAYRDALLKRNEEARTAALHQAEAVVAADPSSLIARRVVLDALARQSDWQGVLTQVDAALAVAGPDAPKLRDLQQTRSAALYQLGRMDDLEAQIKAMIEADPDDRTVQNSLLSLYMNQKRPEAAEDFLRGRLALDTPGAPDRVNQLTAFIIQTRDRQAARDELTRIIDANPPQVALYRALRASLDFDMGNRDPAIAEMRAIIDAAPPADVLNQARVTLARMLATVGNDVGSRALVEEVLAADARNVDALKLKANQLIDDDKTGDALVALRGALEQAPRDPQVMTLMARAYERDGSRDLMGEMLSLAVEASNRAPAESLRYAAFLEQDGKHMPAEDALVNALRLQPQNVDLLGALGRVYVAMKDWLRAEHVARTLTDIGSDQARSIANEITARRLSGQNQDEALAGFLKGLADAGDAGPGAAVALIRTSLLKGDMQTAQEQADKLLAERPQDPAVRFLHASVLLSANRAAEGEAELRKLLADHPDYEQGWAALSTLMTIKGDGAGAQAVLDQGLAALPEAPTLLWAKAGMLERAGDVDGAIRIYEAIYERDSNSPVIANNLASLLSTHRSDAESLDRAYTVARRLRGMQVPAFQDTYGWIAHLRGNNEEALAHLEPAARGLPGDAAVQYHLGMAYAALNRRDEALAVLKRITAAADPAAAPAWLASAQAEITRLEATAAPAATPAGSATATGN